MQIWSNQKQWEKFAIALEREEKKLKWLEPTDFMVKEASLEEGEEFLFGREYFEIWRRFEWGKTYGFVQGASGDASNKNFTL